MQAHPYLVEAIGVEKSKNLQTSRLAAKLNGFVAGAVTIDEFERHVPLLDFDDKVLQYVRKLVIENQGSGLYC